MKLTLDRFEGELAVVISENGERFQLPRKILDGAKEGDLISVTVDADATEEKRKKIKGLMDSLFVD